MQMHSKQMLYLGNEQPLPEPVLLRAGPLCLVFQESDLRSIRLGGIEILSRVHITVRDEVWATLPPTATQVEMEVGERRFRINLAGRHKKGEIDFAWTCLLDGDESGTVSFRLDGEAQSDFRANRIGLCVLHPIRECAGHPCVVEHRDGSLEQGAFPKDISPHQPFTDLCSISHEVIPGVRALVRVEGDVFEMEDQRNFSDATFKIYSGPVSDPPTKLYSKGTRVSQSVCLKLEGELPRLDPTEPRLSFHVSDKNVGTLPRIGLGMASDGEALNDIELARLRALHITHLRADVNLSEADYVTTLEQATGQSNALGLPLELGIFLSDHAAQELALFGSNLDRIKPCVCAWLVFHRSIHSTPVALVNLARQSLEGYDRQAKIGGGTNRYYAQLNRARPPGTGLDLIAYSANPQVHAFDNLTLVENIEGLAHTIQSARQFAGQARLVLSPITLKPRFNPNSVGCPPTVPEGELPSQVDPRQMSLFGAGWTLASLKCLSEEGVYSATYYETTGWRGVMEGQSGSRLTAKFPSLPGSVFPLYHVLADAGEFAGGEVLPTTSNLPRRVEGLALRKGGKTRLMLANLTNEPQQVRIHNLGPSVKVHRLDETTAYEAMTAPEAFRSTGETITRTSGGELGLELLPYGVVRLDSAIA